MGDLKAKRRIGTSVETFSRRDSKVDDCLASASLNEYGVCPLNAVKNVLICISSVRVFEIVLFAKTARVSLAGRSDADSHAIWSD